MSKQIKLNPEVMNDVINQLCVAYEKQISKERIKIYYDTLKLSYDNEDITRMVPIVLGKCKYFPSIADIVSAINDIDYMQQLN